MFFNPNTDADLLHSEVRDDPELSRMAEKVEWEVLDFYSQREMQGLATYEAFFEFESGRDPLDKIKVRLVGYDPDNPEDSEEGLKEALKRTIADILSEVLRAYNETADVSTIRQGSRSVTYRNSMVTWRDFPKGWNNRLHNYDARFSNYGI